MIYKALGNQFTKPQQNLFGGSQNVKVLAINYFLKKNLSGYKLKATEFVIFFCSRHKYYVAQTLWQ